METGCSELQKEFEINGYTSWINSELYPNGKIYTQEYTQWLERNVLILRIALSNIEKCCDNQNPSHEEIWRIAFQEIKQFQNNNLTKTNHPHHN